MAAIESLTTEAIIALVNSGTWPPTYPDSFADLTAVGNEMHIDVIDASSITFHVKNVGAVTMSAGIFAFEASVDSSDGVDGTWFGIMGSRSNANAAEAATPALSLAVGAGNLYSWRFSVAAYKWVRVRCTTAVTATSIARWTGIRGPYAAEPVPVIPTHAVTSTGTATTTPVTPTNYGLISAATTNAAVVKATAAQLFELSVFNPTAAIIYIKLYNKATAPVPGTDIPIISFPVPINGAIAFEFGAQGKKFLLGLGIATTAGPLATDVAAIAVGAQISASYI